MEDNIAIKVEHLSKSFILPHEKSGSIKSALINFRHHQKGYEIQHALKDISFEIRKGEFFGIVGRNGSGKSTLLKLLAGIYAPDKGNIQVNGKLTPFIELGVGFSPDLSGRENVYLNGSLLGFNRKEMDAMYRDIVEFAELDRFMDQKLKNYSSGMQVRLAFSIAIRVQSDILVLDEVLAVGDAAFQKKCYDYFMQLKRDKKTVVLVTHDMSAVRQYCDKALMVNDSKVTTQGLPDKVAQAYQRLFSENVEKPKEEKKQDHWGSGKMECLKPKLIIAKDKITLTCIYKSNVNIPPPVFGFTIYGPTGSNIIEGNTKRKKYNTDPMHTGDIIEITWSFDNIFATGNYSVAVACCDESTKEFYDWFNEAASFIITKEGNTSSLIDPPLEIAEYHLL